MTNEQTFELGASDFEELADYAPIMMWRSRTDKLCDWFNKPWREYCGRSLEALFGFAWSQDVHPDDLDRCLEVYTHAFDAREPFTVPYRLRRKDGAYRWFLDNGAPFYRKGAFAGYVGSCVDITDQREMAEHKEVLLAELNHRVKNNLQLIISFMQLASLKAKGEEAKALMREAINRIQGVGIIQAELHKSGTSRIDLAEYLPNLARAALTAETGDASALEVDVKSAAVSMKLASELGLIVNELITNAVKHGAKHGSSVKISIQKLPDDLIEVVISDNGCGFDASQLGGHLSPGSRLRGLGLVDALASRCGAKLTRENNNGAVVRLQFTAEQLEK